MGLWIVVALVAAVLAVGFGWGIVVAWPDPKPEVPKDPRYSSYGYMSRVPRSRRG